MLNRTETPTILTVVSLFGIVSLYHMSGIFVFHDIQQFQKKILHFLFSNKGILNTGLNDVWVFLV